MTKKNADLIPIKEAANRLDKSVRTLKRYLDKMDNYDKKRLSNVSNRRIFVSLEFVDLVRSGKIPKKVDSSTDNPAPTKKESTTSLRIEALETHNKELFEIIKKKDDLLEEKDKFIKENLQDFKTLTSKVLFLQEENKNLQLPQSSINKEQDNFNSNPSSKDYILLFLAVGLFLLLCVIVAYLLN